MVTRSLVDVCDRDALSAICAAVLPADRVSLTLSCKALRQAVGALVDAERLAAHITTMVAPRELPRKRFQYLIREMAQEFRSDLCFQPEALALLQYAAEQHLRQSFEASAALQRVLLGAGGQGSSSSVQSDLPPMCSHHEHLPASLLDALQPRGDPRPRPTIAFPVPGCGSTSVWCVLSSNTARRVQYIEGRREEQQVVTASATAARVLPASLHPYLAAEDATDDEADADYSPPPQPAAPGEAVSVVAAVAVSTVAVATAPAVRDEEDASMAEAEGEGGGEGGGGSAMDGAASEGDGDGDGDGEGEGDGDGDDGESVELSYDSGEGESEYGGGWQGADEDGESTETRQGMEEEEAAARVVYPLLRAAIARDRAAWRAEHSADDQTGLSAGGGLGSGGGASGSGDGGGDESGAKDKMLNKMTAEDSDAEVEAEQEEAASEMADETSDWSSLYSSSDGGDPPDGENWHLPRKRCSGIHRDRTAACFALTCPACRKAHY
jgi:hypothetical protein